MELVCDKENASWSNIYWALSAPTAIYQQLSTKEQTWVCEQFLLFKWLAWWRRHM